MSLKERAELEDKHGPNYRGCNACLWWHESLEGEHCKTCADQCNWESCKEADDEDRG
jgi:hypothetical protein